MFQTPIDNIFIVIPAKNEAKFIRHVLKKTLDVGFRNIVVVNDSSTDDTKQLAKSIDPNIVVLDHVINLGAGAATKTGIDYAVSRGAQLVATLDADYQHNPKDLIPLIQAIEIQEVDLVIGSRFLKKNKIPVSRIFFNLLGNIVNFFITGLVITDSQSGMKVMSRRFARDLTITYNGYEFCIEIIKNAKINRNSVYEYPIDVRYSKETMQKGQNIFTGVSMLGKFLNPFRNK